MKLLTKAIEKKLPDLYATEGIPLKDKEVIVKFFCPWNQWTWYAVEGQQDDDCFRFWGLVVGFEKEFGYFTLHELEGIRGPAGLRIERDLHYEGHKIGEVYQ
jgi:hypothetical protein